MTFSAIARFGLLAATAALASASAMSTADSDSAFYNGEGILQIGTMEALSISVGTGTKRDDVITHTDASYVAVTFANFDLPQNDLVVVRTPDATVAHFYSGKGRDDRGDFVASFVPGDTAIVEYFTANGSEASATAYTISGYYRGFPNKEDESLCGSDNSEPAKCYASGSKRHSSLPFAYEKSRAVARLLIDGSGLCTGWLIGSEGHLMTNHHCIGSASDARVIDIEFMAESSSCAQECKTQLGCAGTIAATTSTLITNDDTHDYAVVKLPSSAALSDYGYLQFRAAGPKLNEQIYIPQHPVGYAKRIASVVDGGDAATIESVGSYAYTCGSNQVGYTADTQDGSSGSPVIAASDNAVVALHHCGGCENVAVDVRDIISDLSNKRISIANLSV